MGRWRSPCRKSLLPRQCQQPCSRRRVSRSTRQRSNHRTGSRTWLHAPFRYVRPAMKVTVALGVMVFGLCAFASRTIGTCDIAVEPPGRSTQQQLQLLRRGQEARQRGALRFCVGSGKASERLSQVFATMIPHQGPCCPLGRKTQVRGSCSCGTWRPFFFVKRT